MDPPSPDSTFADSSRCHAGNAKRESSSSTEQVVETDAPAVKRFKLTEDETDELQSILRQCVKEIEEEEMKIDTKFLPHTEGSSKHEARIAAPRYPLPRYMMIGTSVPNDTESSPFKFIATKSSNSYMNLRTLYDIIGNGGGAERCTNIESLPLLSELGEEGYEAYMDGEGMMKNLPMNCLVNPFMEDSTLCYMALRGGPYGAAVLFKKNGLSWKKLVSLCKSCDKRERTTEWTDILIRARDAWDAMRQSLADADDE